MKAIIDNKGGITPYREEDLPVVINGIVNARARDAAGQIAAGIYPLVVPTLGRWEVLGDLYLDEENQSVSYQIEAVEPPTITEALAQKQAEFALLEARFRTALAAAAIDKLIDGNSAPVTALLNTLKAAKADSQAKIAAFVSSNDLEGLLDYELNSDNTAALFAAIENLKNDDSGN